MKLSEMLGRVLTDVALRQAHPKEGVCALLNIISDDAVVYGALYNAFCEARRACKQTKSFAYPVIGPRGAGLDESYDDFYDAVRANGMWRGAYGVNRRKLVRDCWRWAKERGL